MKNITKNLNVNPKEQSSKEQGSMELSYELISKAKDFVLRAYEIYSNRADLENQWARFDKLYNSVPNARRGTSYREFSSFAQNQQVYDSAANLFPPMINRAVNSLLNFADEALWAKSPNFKLVGVGGPQDNKRAEINTKILQLQMEKIGFRLKLRDYIKKTQKFGFAIAKTPYVLKQKYVVRQIQKKNSLLDLIKKNFVSSKEINSKEINSKEKVPVYDNIDFIPLSPFNVYWDYFAKWEDQTAIIEKQNNVSESSLRLMKISNPDNYFDIEKILSCDNQQNENYKPQSLSFCNVTNKTKTDCMPHITALTGLTDTFNINKKNHEILECWCNFDIDNDGIEEECVICVLDRKHVIRLQVNPYDHQEKPYTFSFWEEIQEAQSLGVGVVQKAERSQLSLNDFYNQFMDNLTMILTPMWIKDTMAGISNTQLKWRHGGVIDSQTGVGGISPLRPPIIAREASEGIALIKDDITQSTGATASLQGLPAKYDTSATEITQINTSAQRDVLMKLRHIEDTAIKPFLRRAYSYNLQYMAALDIRKILGSDTFNAFLTNTKFCTKNSVYDVRDIIEGDYDFVPLGVTQVENIIVKGQQIMNLYNIALNSPQGIWNLKNMAKLIVKYVADGDISLLSEDVTEEFVHPQDENVLMSQGEKPNAKMQENHKEHIFVHELAKLPEMFEDIRQQHINQHLRFLEIQETQKQQLIMQQKNNNTYLNNSPKFAPKPITQAQVGRVPNVTLAQMSASNRDEFI